MPTRIKEIRENWDLIYSAVFILCPLLSNSGAALLSNARAEFVSVSTSQNPTIFEHNLPIRSTASKAEFNATYGHWADSPTGNLLPVIRNSDESRSEPKHQLTVCVKPLHYNFNRVAQLIEFIEIHRLLGVSHFTFYNTRSATKWTASCDATPTKAWWNSGNQ